MKNILKFINFILTFLICICVLTACSDKPPEITYIYNKGDDKISYDSPLNPKREGYIFDGWFIDEALTIPYDIETNYGQDITIYAKWKIDTTYFVNEASSKAAKACVKITSKYYTDSFNTLTSQGSGVVYKENEMYYFILTNNHVVNKNGDGHIANHTIYDAYGNSYKGELIASDAKYDLAVLRIKKNSNQKFVILEIDESIPEKDEVVISLTSPEGQYNVISCGNMVDHAVVKNEGIIGDDSNILFEVYWTTINIDHGSSGGALINADLKIIGINYAAGKNTNGNIVYSFTVPGHKVVEFLNKNNLR